MTGIRQHQLVLGLGPAASQGLALEQLAEFLYIPQGNHVGLYQSLGVLIGSVREHMAVLAAYHHAHFDLPPVTRLLGSAQILVFATGRSFCAQSDPHPVTFADQQLRGIPGSQGISRRPRRLLLLLGDQFRPDLFTDPLYGLETGLDTQRP